MTGRIRIGLSGWQYAGWRGEFYPPGLPQARELDYASRAVQSIEINGSHYSLQSPSSFQRWHDATPPDFVFSVKGPRYLTHILGLRGDSMRIATAISSHRVFSIFTANSDRSSGNFRPT